eukprot:jgi/Chrzof1/7618/Cz02g30130.t1
MNNRLVGVKRPFPAAAVPAAGSTTAAKAAALDSSTDDKLAGDNYASAASRVPPAAHDSRPDQAQQPSVSEVAMPPLINLQRGVNTARVIKIKTQDDLDLLLIKGFLQPQTAKQLYQWCLTALPWYHVQYKKYGRDFSTPRYTTVFGQDDTRSPPHIYQQTPKPIPPTLQQLIQCVCDLLADGTQFNFTLMNFYLSGQNSISYHSDDESFLGPNPTIASLSLGGARRFLMRHKTLKHKKETFILDDGDLIVMRGPTQSNWEHAVPKTVRAQPRINITLRRAINVAGTNNYYKYNTGQSQVYKYLPGGGHGAPQMVPAG